MADTRYTALVLAATRGGPRDPLAQAGGVSHKAFIDLAGTPMLRRVVEGVIDSGRVGHVIVSIEQDSMDEARQILNGLGGRLPITYTASTTVRSSRHSATGSTPSRSTPRLA